ncbi:homoserine O-acetyltransferase MetX [Smaragdicoccus niigatensis]|uniref:homoserine O-acetyltransferase MetX n=1 Tax=Smaragdicoccus niigatensis TaxID=359359 RepID=UPI000360ADB2|nr:homoserine O-acetyltransferase [Smaragdicoccus niigatensis]
MRLEQNCDADSTAFPSGDGKLAIVPIGSLTLESGAELPAVDVAVQCWGAISAARDNVILVEHALTGDSHVTGAPDGLHPLPGWWDGMVGPGLPLDTDKYCVLATNVLGGCKGTTGPSSIAPDGQAWGSRFPMISIRDQVLAERHLADALGIDKFVSVIGGSMGGMRVLEWMVEYPTRVRSALILAVGARATADQIGTQKTQMAVLAADPDWQGGDYHGTDRVPRTGLGLARQIAHLTYRTEFELDERFENNSQPGENAFDGGRFAVQSYLEHQADKLVHRFDPGSYYVLTEAMNRHDVGRNRGGVAAALEATDVPCVVAGIDSDRLYPLRTQQELADHLPGCRQLEVVASRFGHDGFLTEFDAVGKLIVETLTLAR